MAGGDLLEVRRERADAHRLAHGRVTHVSADAAEWIAATNPKVYLPAQRGPAAAVQAQRQAGKEALGRWLSWAARCRIPVFVALGKKIRKRRAAIDAALVRNLCPR